MNSRQKNLIFTGFQYRSFSCDITIGNILKNMNVANPENMIFERCHFLTDKKQVIVQFRFISDRDNVWKNRRYLNRPNYYVSEDLQAQIQKEHKILYEIAKAVRKLPKFNNKVYINANKLVINGSVYTCYNLDVLSSELHPKTISRCENDTNVVFGGTLSPYNVLSNIYNHPFVHNKRLFSSSKQAFQYGKVCLFNNDASAHRIITTAIPFEQKQIGKKISNFVSEKWNKKRESL